MREEDIKISVKDEVGTGDGTGNAEPIKPMEAAMQFIARYVKPHGKVARQVTAEDIDFVLAEGDVMYNLCHIPLGSIKGAEAIAHTQINDTDPLAFFVNPKGEFIINPVVINSTRHTVDSTEGCMSFPAELPVTIQRYHKITVEFQTLIPADVEGEKPHLSQVFKVELSGKMSKVFQHEVSHLNGWNVYDADATAESCKIKRT